MLDCVAGSDDINPARRTGQLLIFVIPLPALEKNNVGLLCVRHVISLPI